MTRPDHDRDPRAAGGRVDPDERDLEAPAADAVEQSVSVDPAEAETAGQPAEVVRSFEVGEWDALEQSIVINIDDEYDR
jgi:hypothetical protein